MEIVPPNYLLIRTIKIILGCRMDVGEPFGYKHYKNTKYS